MSFTPLKHRTTRCLNCKTDLKITDRFCNYCGQKNNTKKLSLKDFFNEFVSNFYAYDGRFNTSIKTLITKPGIVAKEYIAGKRYKYANPFRLFLSLSIIFYLSTIIDIRNTNTDDTPEIKINKNDSEKDSIFDTNNEFYVAKTIEYHKDSIYSEKQLDSVKSDFNIDAQLSTFKNAAKKYPNFSSEEVLDSIGYEKTRTNLFIYNKVQHFKTDNYFKEIGDFLFQNLALILFLCVPVIAFLFFVVWYSKKLNYTEHLVFTYSFCSFILIGLIMLNIFEIFFYSLNILINIIGLILTLIIFPIYLYKSVKSFYDYSRLDTIIKLAALHILFVPLAIIIISLIVLFGLLLF